MPSRHAARKAGLRPTLHPPRQLHPSHGIHPRIVQFKLEETRQKRESLDPDALLARLRRARPARDFRAALRSPGIALVAEAKYRSPSKGVLRGDFDPAELALDYQRGGADAISVLADSRFFGGAPYVVSLVANLPGLTLPVMYKDFVIDPWQVHEARACGADAVLLIARIQVPGRLRHLVEQCHELGMCALVECFDERDVDAALDSGAPVVGINNRDLSSFGVDFERSERLRARIPPGVLTVAESGIGSRQDMQRMHDLGFNAALVGETLLRDPQPALAAARLKGC